MLLEVKIEFLSEPELQEVIIQRFLAYLDLLSGVLKSVSDQFAVFVRNSIVQFPPEGDFLNDVLNGSFLGPLRLWDCVGVWIVYDVFGLLCG